MKKFLALLLAAAMTLVLAGCAQKVDQPEQGASVTTEETTELANASETSGNLWTIDVLTDTILGESSIDTTVGKKLAEDFGIAFNFSTYSGDLLEKQALMLLAAVFFVQYASTILENLGVLGLAAGALILLAMAGGSLLARLFRLRRAVRRTIVIEVGMQNAAQAIAVATSPLIFDSGEMAVPAIVYALVMNVVLLSYLKLLPKCTDETASEGA